MRKPVPRNKRIKNLTISLPQEIIGKLKKDVINGKEQSPNKMVTKIVIKYYKKIEEKEKNKAQEENITDKKAA
jgi:hypothetical protein